MFFIENAKIVSTRLGANHTNSRILSFFIDLKYSGSEQSFGGVILDEAPEKREPGYPRNPTHLAAELLLGIYEVFRCDWEDLPGTPCRAYHSSGEVQALGHYLDDKWLWLKDNKNFIVTPFQEVSGIYKI